MIWGGISFLRQSRDSIATVLCHSVPFKSPNEPGGATVDIESRDCSIQTGEKRISKLNHSNPFSNASSIKPQDDNVKMTYSIKKAFMKFCSLVEFKMVREEFFSYFRR